MSEGGADLHAHTTASDGRLTPRELVEAGLEARLELLAVTDHDTVDGVADAVAAASGHELEIVPGIELSTHTDGRELHLLGLWIALDSPRLARMSEEQVGYRRDRAVAVVARARRLGLELDMEIVEATADGAPIGRPHLARAMVETGAVGGFDEAFKRYLGIGRPCFVPKTVPETAAAIDAVHDAGGAAVLAHPGASRARETLIARLAECGLDGLEIRHPRHGRQREKRLLATCDRLGLLPSGGSDYHGPGLRNSRLGQYRVEREWAEAIRARARTRRRATEGRQEEPLE